ncbi:1-acyl-sn-glycerol-3-phosphate acyltransferase [Alteromonas facilis]|uniref:1-acyl-sn-glycerol-3-phosphate acyltransferase n=1 Tax=Alteromonas facilis TaxID=2048004 RepID=UPI0013DA17F0|nr:1-acyl-sn-glycerol-3-phosphate acyltransferase [Alteromonas facilis]
MSSQQQIKIDKQLIGPPPLGGNRFTGWLGRTLLKLTGWSFQGELPNFRKMVVAVAPHTSNWDFFLGVAVLFALRIRIRFLGKHTIFVPVVKQLLEAIGGMPVDRRSAHGVVGQVVNEFNQKEEMILAVAPEGTRSPIYPWKTGFLAIAETAKVPVVLIGFDFKLKKIIIGPSISPDGTFEDKMHRVYQFFGTVHAKYPNNVRFSEQ